MKPDSQLRQEVEEELASNPAINATRIGVSVVDSIVTLSGEVSNYAEKRAAEKSAMRVEDVAAVVVKISVRISEPDVRTDEDIALTARSVLDWIAGLEESTVKIKVEKGWVTLSGEVPDGYRSRVAEKSIVHMRGVVGLTNEIRITGQASPVDIEYNIRKAIQRHTDRELKHIGVTVENGEVALSGRVSSASERSIVCGAARSTPGVRVLVDRLTVQRAD